jgi:hypothetical protein
MNYSPYANMAIARQRQEDFIREAQRRDLAALAPRRPGLVSRAVASLGRRRAAAKPASAQPAEA